MRLILTSTAFLATAIANMSNAATHRVPSEYPTINAALDSADFGDSVLVAPGVYTEAETRVIDVGGGGLPTVTSIAFLKDGVTLVGEGGPTMTTLDITGGPITGQGWVLVGGLLPSDETVVDGFRILGTEGLRGAHFQNNGKITVRNCEFLECSFDVAAGIESRFSSLEITGSRISRCEAEIGSAIRVNEANLYMEDCDVEDCTTEARGVVTVDGDSFELWTGEMVIRNCRFRRNVSSDSYGSPGIWQDEYGYVIRTIEGCVFEENRAFGSNSSGVFLLSGEFTEDQTRIVGNAFIGNSAEGQASQAIGEAFASDIHVKQNTFYGNSQTDTEKEMLTLWGSGNQTTHNIFAENFGAPPVGNHVGLFECNVFWNNEPALDPLWVGGANRTVPPQFCDAANGDYTLMTSSPCLSANSEGCGRIGAFGQGCGPVSVSPESWGTIKALYRGAVRP